MYLEYFGLKRFPFSIAPDPDLLFLSPDHKEALAHLRYSLTGHGGLICLTGEVGTGKTTICRSFINTLPDEVDVAYIFNPVLSPTELIQSVCDELRIPNSPDMSNKQLIDTLYAELIRRYSEGRKTICIIDEAQSMPAPLLEQIRLLTNLETNSEKLLTLILVGQPELREILSRYELRQLDQRITARAHIDHLKKEDIQAYLNHRLSKAGGPENLFSGAAAERIWKAASGIPRLINSIADRALLGAYAGGAKSVDRAMASRAISEVIAKPVVVRRKVASEPSESLSLRATGGFLLALIILAGVLYPFHQRIYEYLYPEYFIEELAFLYGEKADSCETIAVNSGQRCLWLDWQKDDIQRLRRPLATYDPVSDRWSLYQNGRDVNEFRGQVLILWEPVPEYRNPLRPGSESPVVDWVRQHLQDEESAWRFISPDGAETSQPLKNFYDPVLAEQVAAFQRENGLKPDRIIGLKTLLMIQDQYRD